MNELYKLIQRHQQLYEDEEIPGVAQDNVNLQNDAAIMEPAVASNEPSDLYELYPDLVNVDVNDPCGLADFFASMCERQQEQAAMDTKIDMVPSLGQVNTPDEF